MKKDLLFELYNRLETVFTIVTISQLFPEISQESLLDRLYYFTRVGKIRRLRRGIYAKNDFNQFELANKLYTPSYISLETVLIKAGVIFQHHETIFLVSYLTRAVVVAGFNFQYRQIKPSVLTNTVGIEKEIGYYIATPERAFLDAVYIYKNYHFDNLRPLDWEKINLLKKIYRNKVFEKRVEEYYKLYKQNNGQY